MYHTFLIDAPKNYNSKCGVAIDFDHKNYCTSNLVQVALHSWITNYKASEQIIMK